MASSHTLNSSIFEFKPFLFKVAEVWLHGSMVFMVERGLKELLHLHQTSLAGGDSHQLSLSHLLGFSSALLYSFLSALHVSLCFFPPSAPLTHSLWYYVNLMASSPLPLHGPKIRQRLTGCLLVPVTALLCKAPHAIDLLSANCCCWWHFTCSVSWGQASSFGNKHIRKCFTACPDAFPSVVNSTLLCATAGCTHPSL